MIRDVLDHGAINVVVKETELEKALTSLSQKPKMVITDSQAFGNVSKTVPEDILLTSFSILFARYKGELREVVRGASSLDRLNDGDTVLISEGCTHHRQCNDIGTVKLPDWISGYTGKNLNFEFTSGGDFPDDLSKYALIVPVVVIAFCVIPYRESRRCKNTDYKLRNGDRAGTRHTEALAFPVSRHSRGNIISVQYPKKEYSYIADTLFLGYSQEFALSVKRSTKKSGNGIQSFL